MRWPARFRDDESGFTLVELIIGAAITGIIMTAIGSALIVALGTTGVTNKRMSESHDVQITSAYLANDVQSTKDGGVSIGSGASCSGIPVGIPVTLVTFAYFGSGQAVYSCVLAPNGETQVTRTFSGQTLVLAHFLAHVPPADPKPTIACTPNANCTGSVDSVTMTFTEASGYKYMLYGARRLYNTAPNGGGTTSPPLTLLATGGNSPLWVQGGCTGGANSDCLAGGTNSLPASDVAPVMNWTPVPIPPPPVPATSLWYNLSDASDSTYIVNGGNTHTEAKVRMASVAPPTTGNPVIDVVAAAVCIGCPTTGNNRATLTVTLYNGAKSTSKDFTIDPAVPPATPTPADFNWSLNGGNMNQVGPISDTAYTGGNLSIGLKMTSSRNGPGISTSINVYGLALDTASTTGSPVLKVIGGLYVNSTLSNAVWLTGKKTVNKLTIVGGSSSCVSDPRGCFQIQGSQGACTGCAPQTVTCSATDCKWHSVAGYQQPQPWMNFSPPIPDPLAYMSAPAQPANGSCGGGSCSPGYYPNGLSISSSTNLSPGVYYLRQNPLTGDAISVTGNSKVAGSGVMFFILDGGLNFGGSAEISLTPPTSGPYQNILVFQWRCPGSNPTLNPCPSNPAPNTSTLKITGGSSATLTFGGVIYAPASTLVSLSGGNANLNVTAVVAQNVKVSGSAQVTVGA